MENNERYEFVMVNSSALVKVGWDKQEGVLLAQFKGSPLYAYPAPREVYEALIKAESKGKFFAEHIRNKYTFKRLDN